MQQNNNVFASVKMKTLAHRVVESAVINIKSKNEISMNKKIPQR